YTRIEGDEIWVCSSWCSCCCCCWAGCPPGHTVAIGDTALAAFLDCCCWCSSSSCSSVSCHGGPLAPWYADSRTPRDRCHWALNPTRPWLLPGRADHARLAGTTVPPRRHVGRRRCQFRPLL